MVRAKERNRQQFNRQAEKFSKHELTLDRRLFEFTCDYCDVDGSDTLLDFACGSGDFVNYCAGRVRHAVGLDVANALLEIARDRSGSEGLGNALFCLADTENAPAADGSFSFATCRSALHHFESYRLVFGEMARTVKVGGKICIQDMVAASDEQVNSFFEEFERCIDASHNRALSADEILALYEEQGMNGVKHVVAERSFNLVDYVGHAHQSLKERKRVQALVEAGLKDPLLSKYFFEKNDALHFKRAGIVVVGIKS